MSHGALVLEYRTTDFSWIVNPTIESAERIPIEILNNGFIYDLI